MCSNTDAELQLESIQSRNVSVSVQSVVEHVQKKRATRAKRLDRREDERTIQFMVLQEV